MNEREIIQHIASLEEIVPESDLIQGIGDDCAVVRRDAERAWLLTLDTLIESVHFDCSFHPPRKLGRKAVSVNVSDIGAMGGTPLFALLSVGMPPDFDSHWFVEFSKGIAEACREYGVLLIGGDTVQSPQGRNFSLTLIGESLLRQVVYRSTARVGDTVWVSGPLGWAAAGLALLQQGKGDLGSEFEPLYEKHRNPQARARFGAALAHSGLVHAMMDLSDGLATDLAHLCKASGVGAIFAAEHLPGHALLHQAALHLEGDPVRWAISGGEDFELLFTAASESEAQILTLGKEYDLSPMPIGRIIRETGVCMRRTSADGTMVEEPVSFQGFDHFQGRGKTDAK
nr:thiamine-phosphate kinase [uncultured Desulfobulbus sp.]